MQYEENLIRHGLDVCYNVIMAHRTFETDKNGRLMIYPSLDGPKPKGIFNNLKILLKRLVNTGK